MFYLLRELQVSCCSCLLLGMYTIRDYDPKHKYDPKHPSKIYHKQSKPFSVVPHLPIASHVSCHEQYVVVVVVVYVYVSLQELQSGIERYTWIQN